MGSASEKTPWKLKAEKWDGIKYKFNVSCFTQFLIRETYFEKAVGNIAEFENIVGNLV